MANPPDPLHTEDLHAFVAAVDAGSLARAARQTGIPKSTLVRRLDRLESQLGIRMLTRSARSIRATAVGLETLDRVRALLDDATDLRSILVGHGAAPRGRLRVSAPADLAFDNELWLGFMEAHPEVELHVDLSNRYVDVVHEGFDVALRGRRGDDDRLVAQRIGELQIVAVASPEWVDAHGVLTDPSEFMSVDCLLLKPFISETPKAPSARHRVCNQLSIVREGALRGLGVAFLPASLIRDDLSQGRLVPVLEAFNPLTVPMFAVYPERRLLPAATRALLAYLRNAFAVPHRSEMRSKESEIVP